MSNIKLITAALFLNLVLQGQEFNDDARLWLYLKLDKDIGSKLNAHLLLQNRFNNNVTEYSQGYADAGLTYKINKHIRFLADYVYGGQRRLDGTYSHIHQVYTGIIFREKIQRWQFIYRLLLQGQMKDIYSSDKGSLVSYYERSKITVKYELNKRVTLFVAEELNSPVYRFSEYYFNRSRSFAGINYQFNKKDNMEAYFLFQRQLKFKNQPNRDFVYGLTWSHSF